MQSKTQTEPAPPPAHVGVIMDGNGRWAARRGLPRHFGHRAGLEAARRLVEAAPGLGIRTLSVFAFSADNWRRPSLEIQELMRMVRRALARDALRLSENGVRLSVIGRRDRLPEDVVAAIARAEADTAAGRRLHLRIALDYSAREAILEAARAAKGPEDLSREGFARLLGGGPDLDLVIRTSGEQRLSDFFLWESAYAELYFTDRLWPDYQAADLAAAVAHYRGRSRRFGGLSAA